MSTPRISIQDLVVERGDFRIELPSLQLDAGEGAVLWGPSGVGKTSALLGILGLATAVESAARGAVRFAGEATDLAGDKSLRYKGRLVFVDKGMDLFGEVAIVARSNGDRPALRIRWE